MSQAKCVTEIPEPEAAPEAPESAVGANQLRLIKYLGNTAAAAKV